MSLADLRLTGRTRWIARLLWLVLALPTLALVVYSLTRGQAYFPVLESYGWTRATYLTALAQLGLTESALDLLLAGSVSLGRVCFIAVCVLLARRATDGMVYFTSLMLLTFMSTATGLAFFSSEGPIFRVVIEILLATGQFCLLLFLFIFPTGRFVPTWLAWPSLLATFFVGVVGHIFPTLYTTTLGGLVSSVAIFWVLVASWPAQFYRYRRVSSLLERQQTKLVLFGLALWLFFGAGSWLFEYGLVPLLGPGLVPPPGTGGRLIYLVTINELQILSPIAVPVTIGLAILRYRLWDIDVLIRRTLIYSMLSAVLAAAYFGSVVILQGLFEALTGERNSALVTVLSTLMIAALFGPVRTRVQRAIDRRFYRQKYDAARTLAAFGAQARDVVALEQLSTELTRAVDDTMQPAHVGLWVRQDGKR